MAKWQTGILILVGVLTIITLAVELPQKISKSISKDNKKNIPFSQPLAGSVRDEKNRPLSGVKVSLPELKFKTTTDEAGRFEFKISAPKQEEVSLMAQKEGYQIYDTFATLGNTGLAFTMLKEK